MITIKMFFEATEEEYKKARVTPGDFYGVVQMARESILLIEDKEKLLAFADEELQAFSLYFKGELLTYWKKAYREKRRQDKL